MTIIGGGTLVGCGTQQGQTQTKLAQDIDAAQKLESKSSLNDVVLEQVNEKGQKLWIVRSKKANYSKEKTLANVENPTGSLFQDNKEVYKIKAKTGEVDQDGNQVFLRGDIVAIDPNNGITLTGDELEWRPKEELMIIRGNLKGTHQQLIATAKEAKVYTRRKQMDLIGQVVANLKDPVAQLKTEYLIWQMEQKKVSSFLSPVTVEHYQNQKVTDKGFAEQVDLELTRKVVTLSKNAQILTVDPPLQIDSKLMSWSLPEKLIMSPGKVIVFDRGAKVTMVGDKGRGDLAKNLFYLEGNVVGVGQKRISQLNADQLTWNVKQQTFDAQGNILYQQLDPLFNLTGPRASGQIKDETVLVQGNPGSGQVVTEIDTNAMKK